MDETKANEILNGHMSIVRKVYGAVPMREAWTLSQIQSELLRMGLRHDRRSIERCVRCLVESGLVRRMQGDVFIRVQIHRKERAVKAAKEVTTPTEVPARPKTLLEIAGQMAAMLRSTANEIEALALSYEDQLKKCGEDSEKLKQLQTLLKGIA